MYYFLVSLNNRNRFDTKVATESSEIPITSWVREAVLRELFATKSELWRLNPNFCLPCYLQYVSSDRIHHSFVCKAPTMAVSLGQETGHQLYLNMQAKQSWETTGMEESRNATMKCFGVAESRSYHNNGRVLLCSSSNCLKWTAVISAEKTPIQSFPNWCSADGQ